MTISWTGGTGLFDVLGKIFYASEVAQTAFATTIKDEVDDILTILNSLTADKDNARSQGNVSSIVNALPGLASGVHGPIGGVAANQIIKFVNDDNPQRDKSIDLALIELRQQMIDDAQTIEASVVSITVAANGANTGDGVIVATVTQADGDDRALVLAEVMQVTVSGGALLVEGELAEAQTSSLWPAGSGAAVSLTGNTGGGVLGTVGNMDTINTDTDLPDDWIVSSGTAGTDVDASTVEVQNIAIAGDPTDGWWRITFTHPHTSKKHTTDELAWNADQTDVQNALRALPGLADITVATTGTTPNLTHAITFTGMGGNLTEVTVIDNLDTGTITPSTPTPGVGDVYRGGHSMKFLDDGGVQTPISLAANTAYGVNLFALSSTAPVASGVIEIALLDGYEGSILQNDNGDNQAITFNASALTTSWQDLQALVGSAPIFRTPTDMPTEVYLRIKCTTVLPPAEDMWIDDVSVVQLTELYAGGPLAAAWAGRLGIDAKDRWTFTVANNRAGEFHEWIDRLVGLKSRGLLLPTDAAPTIADSLIG